jgi:Uma2 family endonuclease
MMERMTTGAARSTVTPTEYLRRERSALQKSEYRDGQIVAMTGASRAHNLIAVNLARELSQQLRGGPCEVYIADMRVKVSPTGLYTYPDVVAACGDIRFEDATTDTLLNPTVLVEVLSPSTEAYDRGQKFAHYRRLESLQEYLLLAQDRVRAEHFVRDGDRWVHTELDSHDEVVTLPSIGCSVRLADVYDRVIVSADEAAASPDAGGGPTA